MCDAIADERVIPAESPSGDSARKAVHSIDL